jgi:peptidoglycan/xylan/chitin deacetylase (PgdA/CDA1 family)
MRLLADHHPLVSLDVVRAWLAGECDVPERAIAVTFDDGLRGVYDHAFPWLERYNIPATVFVVEDFSVKGRAWNGEPALSCDQIAVMARSGMLIGSHGRPHVSLSSADLGDDALAAETAGSKSGLERLLSMRIRYFAYPYTGRKGTSMRGSSPLSKMPAIVWL